VEKALRVIQHVKLNQDESIYATAFRRVANESPERKLATLLAPHINLPGVEAPTGSTISISCTPNPFIIDVRTVEVLFFGRWSSLD